MRLHLFLFPTLLIASGCSSEQETGPPPTPPPSCEEHELLLPDGRCIRPGIGPEQCGEGFMHDGVDGCEPVLPAETCPPGQMAVPGETDCREVMPCGEGTWGDLPIDATTQHVDGSYVGGSSTGTAAQPWPTIQAAVDAALPGSLIAVAAGSYTEEVTIANKPVRLWGICPAQVAIVGSGAIAAGITIRGGANGSEVGGLAIAGIYRGVWMTGSTDLLVEQVWIHDTSSRGIVADNSMGPAAVTVRGSLIENTTELGVFIEGAAATFEHSTVRGTAPRSSDGMLGRGFNVQLACDAQGCDPLAVATVDIRGSVVEHNHDVGIFSSAAQTTIESSVVRGTLPQPGNQMFGRGVSLEMCGQVTTCDPPVQGAAQVRTSTIEDNHDVGIWVVGSVVTVDRTVVRRTQPAQYDGRNGRGINVQQCNSGGSCTSPVRAQTTVLHSVFEQNHEHGMYLSASDVAVEGCVVRDTLPRSEGGEMGRGINVQLACTGQLCDASQRANVEVRETLVEHIHDIGLFVYNSDATVVDTVIRDSLPRASDGLFGDGIAVFAGLATATVGLDNVHLQNSARAGLSTFGGTLALRSSIIQCSVFDIAAENTAERVAAVQDQGDNRCGCPEAQGQCQLVSGNIEPPDPVVADE